MLPLVSVIMPAYNASAFIETSIESVLAQTYSQWELIVVDDGSTDDTAIIVKRLANKDARIHYIWQKNGKQGKARNRGLQEAKGTWISFLDADDVWVSHKLKHQLQLLLDTQSDVVFGYSRLIKNKIKLEDIIGVGNNYYQGYSAINFLLEHGAFIMSTVMVSSVAIHKAGGFVENKREIQYGEDWHMWLKLALQGNLFYTDTQVVSYYRLHEGSATAIEQNAQVKFLAILFDVYKIYPDVHLLRDDLRKRCLSIVYNDEKLSDSTVRLVFDFLREDNMMQYWSLRVLLSSSLFINKKLFRKTFYWIYKGVFE